MALTREKKDEILGGFSDVFKRATSAVFVSFKGLSVSESTDLRRELKKEGVSYKVAKKTLLDRALEGAGYEGEKPEFDGEVAFAYQSEEGDDITATARGVYAFEKKLDGKIAIIGGVFERTFRDKAGMLEIATIPSQDVLRGMFLNVINSPIQGFVMALGAIKDKKEATTN